MKPSAPDQFHLIPESGIERVDGETVASSLPVWLRIEPLAELARCRWVRLRYSSSFFDEPVRPLIRFVSEEGQSITLPMNGPVLGTAEWIGRIPENTAAALISPVRRTGAFNFRLESISSVSRVELIRRGLRSFDWLYWAGRSWLLNSRREAWQALSFAAGGTPIDDYNAWRANFDRRLELGGFDRPRTKWQEGPTFHLLLDLHAGNVVDVERTISTVRRQAYPRWRLCVVNASPGAGLAAFRRQREKDSRLTEATLSSGQSTLGPDSDRDFLAILKPGDTLPVYALAVVAEEASRVPDVDVIYGDEDQITEQGKFISPVLKPDWSPIFQRYHSYLGRGVFIRAGHIGAGGWHAFLADHDGTIDGLARALPKSRIHHVRRVLYSRHDTANGPPQSRESHFQSADPPQWPEVAIVIPTRDQAKLLARCIAGLQERTDYPSFELIVIDNDSTEPDAVQLLEKIAREPRTKVLLHPGRFNFSALSNAGAQASDAAVLLFLNNDVVSLEPGWLKAMVRWAIKPEIGVVGAKLLFADGRIQHAGVVLGFGGIAGHVYRRSPKDHAGYLSQVTVPREVSAVTAACVAVERSKFEAVGGFDAENLPVDLNDIDLCLRLAERGCTNLWTPEAALVHEQSATRGIDKDPYELYRKERDYFVRRWADIVRDDPYFHPALSLYAHDVALA
jgi:O-antigen biosynthesis protein